MICVLCMRVCKGAPCTLGPTLFKLNATTLFKYPTMHHSALTFVSSPCDACLLACAHMDITPPHLAI